MKNSNQGTPHSLLEAVINALVSTPMRQAPESLEMHVKDFLAQGLTAALLKYDHSPEAIEAIEGLIKLWGIGQKRQAPSELVQAVLTGDVQTVADQLGLKRAK